MKDSSSSDIREESGAGGCVMYVVSDVWGVETCNALPRETVRQ